jgi:hypothetical protein
MALLSQMIRSVAITGSTDRLNAWFGDRQGQRWAEQTVRAAFPAPAASRPPEDALRELTELRASGVVTDDEFDRLRARLRL